MFDFIIVGKKDKDRFVIYDNREGMGGKALISTYTINQIVNAGYNVCGVNSNMKGKIVDSSITIMNLDCSPAVRISRCDDVFPTLLQATTVIKGLKRSKADIKKAKEIGEKRSASIQARKEREADSDIVDFYKNFLGKEKGSRMTIQKICKLYNYGRKSEDKVEDFEMLFDKNGKSMPVYYSKSKDVTLSRRRLLQIMQDWENKCGLENGLVKFSLMSQYSKTNREITEYVLKTTTKKILYTYGLKYRGPATMNQPISNKDALRHFESGMCDVREYDDYIDLNEYSANDMW